MLHATYYLRRECGEAGGSVGRSRANLPIALLVVGVGGAVRQQCLCRVKIVVLRGYVQLAALGKAAQPCGAI